MGQPITDKSSRPHWLSTHPDGRTMVEVSISGLLLKYSMIYFIVHKDVVEKYQFWNHLHEKFRRNSKLVILDENTKSQPDTVYQCIKLENITGQIVVKDSDNFFVADNVVGNCVCYFDLNDGEQLNARDKSYIECDVNGFVTNIVEKKIINSLFSVGGYGFEDAQEFCKYFEKIKSDESVYMSNVIFQMILDSKKFRSIKVERYEDWGTVESWNAFVKTFRTLFIDIDGVLIENTASNHAPFTGTGKPILENINILKQIYETGRTHIVLTTSRPTRLSDITIDELDKYDIPYDDLIIGLPHCQRIIINDFAPSNPYPSCNAINLKRNATNLRDYL